MNKCLMLMGGGIDSTLVALILLKKCTSKDLFGLHIDYGHPASESEYAAVKTFCGHHGIGCSEIKISFPTETDNQEIPGRNMVFLLVASSIADRKGFTSISVGFHRGTICYDQTDNFIGHAESIILGYFSGRISIYHPLINLNKKEVIELSKVNGLDFASVYSCQAGTSPPCGKCPSCLDRNLV
jgi:7-cyano-7-deazaguanine synthase